MCGICCRLQRITKDTEASRIEIDSVTRCLLHNRGPNAHDEFSLQTENFNVLFSGFVLWQQGAKLCVQPHRYKHHVLLINGDIFSKRDDCLLSDTEWLIRRIDECNDDEHKLTEVFRTLEGPFSIFYYNKNTSSFYFFRDILGRQSLLLAKSPEGDLVLSSVLGASNRHFSKCIELPPLGIFCQHLLTEKFHVHPWQPLNESHLVQLNELQAILEKDIDVRASIDSPWLVIYSNGSGEDADLTNKSHNFNFESILKDHIKKSSTHIFDRLLDDENVVSVCDEVLTRLEKSVSDRISATPSVCRECLSKSIDASCDHARIGILFSGGIDCSILAVLTDKLLDQFQTIDLINVSFEKINRSNSSTHSKAPIDYNTPDRISAKESLEVLRNKSPQRKWNLVEVNVTRDELDEALKSRIPHLVYPLSTVLDESIGSVLWFGARGRGLVDGNEYTSNCRVLLIGSGADELFGGYTRHRNAFIRQYDDCKLSPYDRLEQELEFDFQRLPSRNLARDDRVIGDHGVTSRSPFLEEEFVYFIRSLKPFQKCYHALEPGVGDKLLLRFCGYRIGLNDVSALKKRAMQFGSRIADRKQNAKDTSQFLVQILDRE